MFDNNQTIDRRRFLHQTTALTGLTALATLPAQVSKAAEPTQWKAVIIGHTGRGNYGHDHDLVFNDRPNIEVAAVADPDEKGRAQAATRSHALRQYADYREMLERERPQLVSIAQRWTDQHYAMGEASLEIGAHVYMEKPFTQTLAQADELLSLAQSKNRKIVVAHQMPLAPSMIHLQSALKAGLIGELLQIKAHGKQDTRAGAEDMVVLGTHLFDLMRRLAGDPISCAALIRSQGKPAVRGDIRKATEDLGPIIGDEIEAQFEFPKGVAGTFTSRAAYRETAGPWGMDLIGSKGTIRILTEIFPKTFLLKPGTWSADGRSDQWQPLPNDPSRDLPAAERGLKNGNQRLVDDWLVAIRDNREPVCNGRAAMKSLEMIMAVFQAGLNGTRVPLPLTHREHPLG